MAIAGQQNLNIGVENESTNSDSLFAAFNKIQNNFTTIFTNGSSYNNFIGANGVAVSANNLSGTITLVNTGVTKLIPGTGITVDTSNGNVTISASGNGVIGVTNVGVSSNTLIVRNTPIVSSGTINVDLPNIPVSANFIQGTYIAPTVKVDQYGRVIEIANTTSVGTVTSVAIEAVGTGLVISNSPITDSGTIYIENKGVTSIRAGTGINLSGTSGDITITALNNNPGTVTQVGVTSDTLTVTGSPITSSGIIGVELPDDLTLTGNLVAVDVSGTTLTGSLTTASQPNITSVGSLTSLTVTGNVVSGNVNVSGTIKSNGTAGIGYATGAGNTVAQTSSRTSPVTINAPVGAITLVSAAGSASYVSFTVTNSCVAATDVIIINQKSGTNKYEVYVTNVATNSFQVTFASMSGTTAEAPTFNFAVIKGVTA